MPLNPSLIPHSSEQHTDREEALHDGGDALLTQLALDDDPAAALPELESYINGIYAAASLPHPSACRISASTYDGRYPMEMKFGIA